MHAFVSAITCSGRAPLTLSHTQVPSNEPLTLSHTQVPSNGNHSSSVIRWLDMSGPPAIAFAIGWLAADLLGKANAELDRGDDLAHDDVPAGAAVEDTERLGQLPPELRRDGEM